MADNTRIGIDARRHVDGNDRHGSDGRGHIDFSDDGCYGLAQASVKACATMASMTMDEAWSRFRRSCQSA